MGFAIRKFHFLKHLKNQDFSEWLNFRRNFLRQQPSAFDLRNHLEKFFS